MNIDKRRQIIIDFEVLYKANFWMCCMKDYQTGAEHTIINDREEFLRVFNKNKDAIWLGYNIKGYDQWLIKALICDSNPCIISHKLINEHTQGWQIDKKLNNTPVNIFELGDKFRSLKELELFMGESIQESTVSFELDRYPTQEEIDDLTKYCLHDVRMTYKVFEFEYYKFEAQKGLIDFFNLDVSMFNKTEAQLSAYILGAKKPEFNRDDTYDFKLVDTLKLDKYSYIKDWYMNPSNRDNTKYLNTVVYGVETDFGWGGLHSALVKYKGEGFIVNSDVSSFYPAIMIEYGLLSRNVYDANKFKQIRDTRIKFKKEKNKIEKSLKIVLNSTYGASKDVNNELYDPMHGNAICVNGQLLLLDLIEKVEMAFGNSAKFIQGNTDGVMFKFNSKEDVDKYIGICDEWCSRTRMNLEHDLIDKIIQKDVNNYIYIQENGKIKSKGAYLKELNMLDNDLPIVNKALKEKLLYDIPIEETINNSTDLIDFQKCVKISSKYSHAVHGMNEIHLKVLRVFASNYSGDSSIMKVKNGKSPEKIGNTPDKAFIVNDNIIGATTPDKLDKNWYISLAKKRLDECISEYEYTLFDLI